MSAVKLERMDDGRLKLLREDGSFAIVYVRPCFPWSARTQHISLRAEDDEELALVEDLEELDADSRAALKAGLEEAAYVPVVTAIESIDTEYEIRNWKVQTLQGACTFQTKLDEWPREMPNGSLVIRAITGNLFEIGDPAGMDEASRKRLWAFID